MALRRAFLRLSSRSHLDRQTGNVIALGSDVFCDGYIGSYSTIRLHRQQSIEAGIDAICISSLRPDTDSGSHPFSCGSQTTRVDSHKQPKIEVYIGGGGGLFKGRNHATLILCWMRISHRRRIAIRQLSVWITLVRDSIYHAMLSLIINPTADMSKYS